MSKLELNKIYQLDVLDFLPQLENKSIDLAIADPPYNMAKGDWDRFENESIYFDFMHKWLIALLPKLKDSASLYLFNNAYNSAMLVAFLRQKSSLCFRNWITWYKKDGFSSSHKKYVNSQETLLFYTVSNDYTFNYDSIRIPYISQKRLQSASNKGILKNGKRWFPNENGKLCTDVWEITSQRHKEKEHGKVQIPCHPTIKPYEMIERLVKASSLEKDLVLDLFSGSGQTSIVAKKLCRNFIGCEANLQYIKLINSRLKSIEAVNNG